MAESKRITKKFILRFRAINRDTFEAIRIGKKRIETRAATPKYSGISDGVSLVFVCGNDRFEKTVKKTEIFPSIGSLFKKHKPPAIDPKNKTVADGRKMYYSFPGYKEKIRKFGLIAWELK